jgi:predicted ATPase
VATQQDILTIEGRPGLAHQRGLPDTLAWSYQMLDKPSRTLLARLAAFDGPFRTEDAERACSAPPLREPDIAALLSDLADNSLVHTTGNGTSHSYRLLAPIRAFADRQAPAATIRLPIQVPAGAAGKCRPPARSCA